MKLLHFTKRNYGRIVLICLISLTVFSCFKLKSVDQPGTAESNSYFDVTIVCEEDNFTMNVDSRGLFAALLPEGWTIRDYNSFNVYFPDGSEITGEFAYDQFYSDFVTANMETPDGYYWFGMRTIDQKDIYGFETFSFTVRIFTDEKTGNFNLRYVVGDDTEGDDGMYMRVITEYMPISITKGPDFPSEKETDWELVDNAGWDESIAYYNDVDYNNYFRRWVGWNGGDVAISTLLPDGRSAWTFGDSFTGFVSSDRTRRNDLVCHMIRNAVLVQEGESFSSFRMVNSGNKPGADTALFVYSDDEGNPIDGEWYWPFGANVYYRNGVPELQVLMEHIKSTGDGAWDMEYISCDVAVLDLPGLTLREIVKDRQVGPTSYAGNLLLDDDGVVYIYGDRTDNLCGAATFVARNMAGDLTGEWEFYNGKTNEWSKDNSWGSASDWADYKTVGNSLFVFKDGGKYFAFEQSPCFGRESYVYDAESPIGPFTNKRLIGKLPEDMSTGNFFCYIPAVHQQFSENGELLYSISKNYSGDFEDLKGQAGSGDLYKPHFFRVKNWRPALNISSKDITTNDGELTASSTENLNALTDKNVTSVYGASVSSDSYIQYVSPSPGQLRRYTITSGNDQPEKDPLHWKVLGSNDGLSWVLLDERYYVNFEQRNQTISFTVPIDGEFTHFRMQILAANASSDFRIAEWQLFGKAEGQKEVTGIENTIRSNKWLIYPNPAKTTVHIKNDAAPIEEVRVANVSGLLVYQSKTYSNEQSIDVSAWASGIYVVTAKSAEETIIEKIIKK